MAALVLVAEDNDANFELVEFLLSELGVEVLRATNGEEALAMAAARAPGLLLLDIQLPRLDGLQLARRLRAESFGRALPIVAVSALAMGGDRERALSAGCDAYLSKPISPGELQDLVREFLGLERGGE